MAGETVGLWVKTYRVRLTDEERRALEALATKGRVAARKATHARILLKADEGPERVDGEHQGKVAGGAGRPAWTDARIVEALEVGVNTVQRLRKRCLEEGALAALARRPSSAPSRRKLDGRAEAQLIALSCGVAPDGREGWSLRLLAEQMVELEYVDALSHETVRRVLKKTSSSPGSASSG